jgi:hypothetical protein
VAHLNTRQPLATSRPVPLRRSHRPIEDPLLYISAFLRGYSILLYGCYRWMVTPGTSPPASWSTHSRSKVQWWRICQSLRTHESALV